MAKTITIKSASQIVTASARSLHVAPRKMRLVTNMVKNMYVGDALAQLVHTNKKASPILIKLLNSAIANAENNFSLNPEWLYIKEITCDMGNVMKRYFPRARGSAFIIRRKLCHVNVALEERKRGAVKDSRNSFIKKLTTTTKHTTQSLDADAAVHEKPSSVEPKKSQVTKSNEQIKQNTVAQKRRLFNRKTGE